MELKDQIIMGLTLKIDKKLCPTLAINNWGESDKRNYKHKTKVGAKLKS